MNIQEINLKTKICALSIFITLLLGICVHAADVTLQWDANSESDLQGYRIYKTEVEGSYTYVKDNPIDNNKVWEGADEFCTIQISDGPYECWFVATAYDKCGNESDPSNEVKYDTEPPISPGSLWGNPNLCRGDFDQDSDVDGSDLAIFATNFGRTDCLP